MQFAKVSSGENAANFLSFEAIPELEEASAILVEGSPANDDPVSGTAELFSQPLWQELTPVKEGRVYALHHFYALHYKQALAVLEQFEGILQAL